MTPYQKRDAVAFLLELAMVGCMFLVWWCAEYAATMNRRACIALGVLLGVLLCWAIEHLREYRNGERW